MLEIFPGEIFGPISKKKGRKKISLKLILGFISYSYFIQAHFKSVVFFPQYIDGGHRNTDSTLVCFTQQIHLLLILPTASSNGSRPVTDKLNKILPYSS